MKITNAWIDDPTLRGELQAPGLCVEVTEMPDVTIEREPFAGGWSVAKYGPFVKYWGPAAEASDFNTRFRNRFPVIVDVTLFVVGSDDPRAGYSLPLTRGRQLLRKYDPTWRLLVSDRAAESGSLLWLPVQSNITCRFWLGDKCCGDRPAKHIRVNDVDFAMCAPHVSEHNARQASKRAARA